MLDATALNRRGLRDVTGVFRKGLMFFQRVVAFAGAVGVEACGVV